MKKVCIFREKQVFQKNSARSILHIHGDFAPYKKSEKTNTYFWEVGVADRQTDSYSSDPNAREEPENGV